jgi:hypothetical protein
LVTSEAPFSFVFAGPRIGRVNATGSRSALPLFRRKAHCPNPAIFSRRSAQRQSWTPTCAGAVPKGGLSKTYTTIPSIKAPKVGVAVTGPCVLTTPMGFGRQTSAPSVFC